MRVWAFVVSTCILHKALNRLCRCACLSGLLLYVHICYIRRRSDCTDAHASLGFCCMYMYATSGADQTALMHMIVWDFVVRTCTLHKVLVRLRGYTCLSGLLLYVHVCYIRCWSDCADTHACLGFCCMYMYAT